MPDDTNRVPLGAGDYLYPGRAYVAVATFRSDIPHAGLGALVSHLARLVSARVNWTYPTLSRFVVSRSEVVPWQHPGQRGQHIAQIFFYVTPRIRDGLSFPLTAGQVRAVCYAVFRENAGPGNEVWIKEVLTGADDRGAADDGPGRTQALGILLVAGIAVTGAIFATGRRR